jgi:hypothetical protein
MSENILEVNGNKVGNITVAKTLCCEKTCHICGKYFRKGEEVGMLIIPFEYRKQYPTLKQNKLIHISEFQEYTKNINTLDGFYEKLANTKVKKEKLSEENHKKLEIFIEAAYNCGYRYPSKITSKGTVKSDYVIYNVYSDTIQCGDRRKGFLFDSLIDSQKATKIYNEFHALLDDGLHSDFNALETLGKVLEKKDFEF